MKQETIKESIAQSVSQSPNTSTVESLINVRVKCMFVFDIEANSKNVKMDIKRILARVDFEIKT